jgi:hypothetical protein
VARVEGRVGPSGLPEQRIHHPTSSTMRPNVAQVAKDLGVVAAGFFEGVG